jgi:hypothetical protein
LTARGCGFVTKNTAVGPPAAEFVKDTKLIGSSIGVADPFVINKEASAIVPSTTRTATPKIRNRLVVLGILYATRPKSDDASVGTARARSMTGELGRLWTIKGEKS